MAPQLIYAQLDTDALTRGVKPKRDTDKQTDAKPVQLNYQRLVFEEPTKTAKSNSRLQTPENEYPQLDNNTLTSGMKNKVPVSPEQPTRTQKDKVQHVRAVKNSQAIELYFPEQEQINELRTEKFLLIEKFKKKILILEQRKINKFLNSLIKLFTIGIINFNNKIEKKISNYNNKIEKQINISNQKFNIELTSAASFGHLEIVKFLVENGANVNYQNPSGFTALMAAASIGDLEIVKFLVENGAKIHLEDVFSVTALTIAAKNGHKIIEEYLKSCVLDSKKNDEANARDLHQNLANEIAEEAARANELGLTRTQEIAYGWFDNGTLIIGTKNRTPFSPEEQLDPEAVNAIVSQQTHPNTQSRTLQL